MNSRIRKSKRHILPGLVLVAVSASVLPGTALAYIGPGAGLSLIGSVLAFLAAIVVAIFGFLFFPIRRMLRKRKQKAAAKESPAGARTAGDPEQSEAAKATAGPARSEPRKPATDPGQE